MSKNQLTATQENYLVGLGVTFQNGVRIDGRLYGHVLGLEARGFVRFIQGEGNGPGVTYVTLTNEGEKIADSLRNRRVA